MVVASAAMGARLCVLLGFVLTAACGPTAPGEPGGGGGDGVDAGPGTPTCDPGFPVCVGDNVHVCADDGTPGAMTQACEGSCFGGQCVGGGDDDPPPEDECAGGAAEYVWVVDNANALYAFDPAGDAHTFTSVGTLSCPAGAPIISLGGPATPFSMSVDRDAVAWVLYSSGELFKVSTDDASCQATGFMKQQQGYDLFGMGFVSDTMGSSAEKLFIAGSVIDPVTGEMSNHKLGYIDVATSLVVNNLQPITGVENPPELTGTGAAKLYGYFPGAASTIRELDKTTGAAVPGQQWAAGSIPSGEMLAGWAFAQWGGRFYVFVTTSDFLGLSYTSRVLRVDPATGQVDTVREGAGVPFIVGAGVSTCAPIVVE